MKFFKYLALLAATTMFLAACQQSEDEGGTSATTGTLTVVIEDASTGADVTGDIAVTQNGSAVDTASGVSSESWDVAPGQYEVAVSNAAGYNDLSAQSVTVVAGETRTYRARMISSDAATADVATVEFSLADENGDAYATATELNYAKDATLFSAQTEENIEVTVTAKDADGNPVPNASITVNITENGDGLSFNTGQLDNTPSTQARTFLDSIVTDANGEGHFIIQSTAATTNGTLSDTDGGQTPPSYATNGTSEGSPVKLIVSAKGANDVPAEVELKGFFVDMSHLWYGEGENPGSTASNVDFVQADADFTARRMGAQLDDVNIWDEDGDNAHYFGTFATDKQPTSAPYNVPGGNAQGYVTYELVEVSTDADGNALVEWDTDRCDNFGTAATETDAADGVCTDDTAGGEGVGLVPTADASVEDLPLTAVVDVTYVFQAPYGDAVENTTDNTEAEPYEFALKSYTVTKTWSGGFLMIDKYVDQHVLTWEGEAHTLPASDSSTPEGGEALTSTVYITVQNDSEEPMYDVSVRDVVPAELGVVTGSISAAGTYDATNHAVTWQNDPDLATLEVGESKTFTFDVYARQKPGYPRLAGATRGDISPVDHSDTNNAYPDPYCVTNGGTFQDIGDNTLYAVTASAYRDTDADGDGTGDQIVYPYIPEADESDVCVVRPLFALDKSLKNTNESIQTGSAATFEISVRQIDRVSDSTDSAETSYASLAAQYPWEFDGALGDGTGHQAPESEVRNNPYAFDVEVFDRFEFGLDFTQGTDFDGGFFTDSSPKVQDKGVDFDAIETLPVGTTETAEVVLTGNLPSADVDGSSVDTEAFRTLSSTDLDAGTINAGVDSATAWNNCAYMGAPQLNQPVPSVNSSWTDTWYHSTVVTPGDVSTSDAGKLWFGTDEAWREFNTFSPSDHGLSSTDTVSDTAFEWQWHQVGPGRTGTHLMVVSGTYGTFVSQVDADAAGKLESCAPIVVTPPQNALLNLSTDGEFDPAIVITESDVSISDDKLTGDVSPSTEYVYVLSGYNSGNTSATNVVVTAELGSGASFTGTAEILLADNTGTANDEPFSSVESQAASGQSLTFDPVEVGADRQYRIVIPAASGSSSAQLSLDVDVTYDEIPAWQEPALEASEPTTVN